MVLVNDESAEAVCTVLLDASEKHEWMVSIFADRVYIVLKKLYSALFGRLEEGDKCSTRLWVPFGSISVTPAHQSLVAGICRIDATLTSTWWWYVYGIPSLYPVVIVK